MPLCVLGDPEDLTSAYVAWVARIRGIEVIELAEAQLGSGWSATFDDASPGEGRLQVDGVDLALADVTGVFVRLNPRPALPAELSDLPAPSAAIFRVERRAGLHYLLDRLPGMVMNRPSSGRSNGSKPYQMCRLAAYGFAVPDWLATNTEEAVRTFAAGCSEGAIYKSCSGLRSQVRRPDESLLERLTRGSTPVVVQRYVPGRDVRLHVVGDRWFATEVAAPGLDYRFEPDGAAYRAVDAPAEIAQLCVRATRGEGLALAGFDFRVDPADRWHCLEVNPVPTFLPYEMSTGQPIADSIVDLLVSGPSGRGT